MKKTLILVCVAIVALASCKTDREDPKINPYIKLNDKQKVFAEKFDKIYGETSKEMTWMTADASSVNINLANLSGNYTIQIYTDDPTADTQYSYVLAEYKGVAGGRSHTIDFDYPVDLNYAYVSAIGADGKTYTGRFSLKDSETSVNIGNTPDVSWKSRPAMHYCLEFEGYNSPEGCDFDYNEVVLDLEYVRGRSNIGITLCAAGASCHTSLGYRRETNKKDYLDDVIFEEVHEALGFPAVYSYATGKNIYYILNTGLNDISNTVTRTLALGEDEGHSICEIAPKIRMYLRVDDTTTDVNEYHIPEEEGSHCPEALLLAVPDFNWTPEGMSIHVQYSRFPYWVAFPDEYPLWYTTVWDKVNASH